MHSYVTSKNVKWCHLIWPTLYIRHPASRRRLVPVSVRLACAPPLRPDRCLHPHDHTVFRSVVVAKLLYACTAWSGFVTASDRHRVDAFRSKRCGYCHPTNLWRSVTIGCFTNSVVTLDIHYITFSHHPPRHHNTTTSAVDQHNRQLPARTGHLTDGNFITRFVV